MPKILDDVMEDLGDWWWRFRTPEGSRAWVFERDGSFYNKYRARLWRITAAGRGFIYGGHDLVIVPSALPHKLQYELERVPEQKDKDGNVIEPEHGRPKNANAALAAAEAEKKRARRELTGVELGVFEGEWLIGVKNGEMVACPFTGTGVSMDEDELSAFFRSHVMTDLETEYERMRAGGMGSTFKILLFVAAAVIIGFIVWKFALHGHTGVAPGNVTPTITPFPQGAPIYSMLRGLLGV